MSETDRADWAVAEPRWALFHHNQDVWEAVFAMCEGARHSLDIEQYIFAYRGVGARLLDLLTAKARQGVAVRVLADGLGSFNLTRSKGGRELLGAGGQIRIYNDVAQSLRHPIARAHRLHRKTVIADGCRAMFGGSCYQDRMCDWRDTMIRVEGPLPPLITTEFERAWRFAAGEPVQPAPARDVTAPHGSWSYALSGPLPHACPDLGHAIKARIAGARRSVRLTTPYLIPDRELWRAFLQARANGAEVQIVMPGWSDHWPLDRIGHRFAHALVRRGVRVLGYRPSMLHSKIALIDGDWCAVSSFNLDWFSARLNLENGILSTSRPLYDALAAQLDEDASRSIPF